MKKQILFVDDEQRVLASLRRVLQPCSPVWEMAFFDRPEKAWDCLQERPFDVVVSDIKMPGMNGLQLLEHMQGNERTRGTPVVLLTGLLDSKLKRQALDLGATDLLSKPIEVEELLARLRSAIRLKACQDELLASNRLLEERVQRRTEQLLQTYRDLIWRLGKVAEHRDMQSGNHVIRVGCMSRAIGLRMGLDRGTVENLFLAAPLHDIGKIAIPDKILMKDGPLNAREWVVMKRHCEIGERILREDSKVKTAFLEWRGACCASECEAIENRCLEMAATIALTHHEKWDGSGYPQGLVGEEIPQEARIVAIVDVFDAICSRRPYKAARPEQETLEIIRASVGSQFDPEVYAAFIQVLPEIRTIQDHFNEGVAPELKYAGRWDMQEEDEYEEEMQYATYLRW